MDLARVYLTPCSNGRTAIDPLAAGAAFFALRQKPRRRADPARIHASSAWTGSGCSARLVDDELRGGCRAIFGIRTPAGTPRPREALPQLMPTTSASVLRRLVIGNTPTWILFSSGRLRRTRQRALENTDTTTAIRLRKRRVNNQNY